MHMGVVLSRGSQKRVITESAGRPGKTSMNISVEIEWKEKLMAYVEAENERSRLENTGAEVDMTDIIKKSVRFFINPTKFMITVPEKELERLESLAYQAYRNDDVSRFAENVVLSMLDYDVATIRLITSGMLKNELADYQTLKNQISQSGQKSVEKYDEVQELLGLDDDALQILKNAKNNSQKTIDKGGEHVNIVAESINKTTTPQAKRRRTG